MSAVGPRGPAPAKRAAEVDFRSGTVLEQLSAQVQELVQLEQCEFGDQTALEVHTAKDFIFNMLGECVCVCICMRLKRTAKDFIFIMFRDCVCVCASVSVCLKGTGKDLIFNS